MKPKKNAAPKRAAAGRKTARKSAKKKPARKTVKVAPENLETVERILGVVHPHPFRTWSEVMRQFVALGASPDAISLLGRAWLASGNGGPK